MQKQRHLAAILFTDIVGYTAMMQENEMKAVTVVKRYHAVLEPVVTKHSGEILNDYGDGSLCTFPSASEAVEAALELQQKLKEEPVVPLRIGLHIGEVFFEGGKVLGDGVNVASRIQSLGHANTILLSGEINNKISNHPEFSSVSLGRFEFKNVNEPVEVFALSNPGLTVPRKETMTGKLKEPGKKSLGKKSIIAALIVLLLIAAGFIYYKFQSASKFTGKEKSIAVLPFNNMSSDKENEYFSDGMTEEITTRLAKIGDLKVIARTSSMMYKESKKSIRQIAEELGVSAILEGSVQKTGDKIRITAQLIDANTQEHIWAEKYDREFKDIFDVQSEVAQEIAYQLNANLTKEEKNKIEQKPTNNLEAYQYYLQGMDVHWKFFETVKLEYFNNSKTFFEKALRLDSNYALAHAALADLYNTYTNFIKQDSALLSLQIKESEIAYSLDSTHEYVNFVKGVIMNSSLRKYEEAYRYFRRALEINPNEPDIISDPAILLNNFGLVDEAVIMINKAIKLDPLTAANFKVLADCELGLGKLKEATTHYQTALQLEPGYYLAMFRLVYIYSLQNKMELATEMFEKASKLDTIDRATSPWVAFYYAKLGNKKKALETRRTLRVYLALGMKREALEDISNQLKRLSDTLQPNPSNDYLRLENLSSHKDFDIIRNEPLFLEFMGKSKQQYEKNKKRFSMLDLIN